MAARIFLGIVLLLLVAAVAVTFAGPFRSDVRTARLVAAAIGAALLGVAYATSRREGRGPFLVSGLLSGLVAVIALGLN